MQQGDRVSFTMSCDDGPGTPVREEEREGIIVMLTKSTYPFPRRSPEYALRPALQAR